MKKTLMSRGFTLIELLIVIAIIAILSGIILVSLSSSRVKARDAKRVSDVAQLQLALEQYFDRCGQYPLTLSTGANNCNASGITLGTFISQIPIPQQPSPSANYDYTIGGNPPSDYIIHASLEGTNDAQKDSLTQTYEGQFFTTYGPTPGNNTLQGSSAYNCYDSVNSPHEFCLGPK